MGRLEEEVAERLNGWLEFLSVSYLGTQNVELRYCCISGFLVNIYFQIEVLNNIL